MKQLSEDLKVVSCLDPKAQTAGTYTGDAVDLADFDRVMYVLSVGSIPASGTLTYSITTSTTSNGTYAAITGGSLAADIADDQDNQQYIIEVDCQAVKAAGNRYLKDNLIIAGTTVAVSSVAIGHPARYSDEPDLASVASIVAV